MFLVFMLAALASVFSLERLSLKLIMAKSGLNPTAPASAQDSLLKSRWSTLYEINYYNMVIAVQNLFVVGL